MLQNVFYPLLILFCDARFQRTVFSVEARANNCVCICIQAFEGAWAAACKQGASTVLVPPELEFLVGPIST